MLVILGPMVKLVFESDSTQRSVFPLCVQKPDSRGSRGSLDRDEGGLQPPVSCFILLYIQTLLEFVHSKVWEEKQNALGNLFSNLHQREWNSIEWLLLMICFD